MKSIYIAFILLCTFSASGQVRTKIFLETVPAKLVPSRNQVIPVKKITASAEFKQLLSAQAKNAPATVAYKHKFAVPVNAQIDLLTEGKVIETKGYITYALIVDAEGAMNVSVQFSKFHLSPGAVLSIYTQSEITDSITANENNPSNYWSTRVYQGNTLTFFLKVPVAEKGKTALTIDEVRFGYKKFGTDYHGNPGASADCNINVVCPAGTGWENERNSVAIIVSGGVEDGTGVLMMNTCNTNIPYVLTADHLSKTNLSTWVFQFQTWSSVCTLPNTGWREDVQFNGCQLRANDAATDFTLVQLNTIPPANSGITYSGWNRGNVAATSATGIHHPMGDLMKISHELNPVTPVAFQGGPADHWQVTFDQGIVQHGSSGSPLYDQNHRVIGQLHGNQNNGCMIGDNTCFCIQPPVGEYGRFDVSWTGGGTNTTRLSNWLDPSNSGAMITNTTNINALSPANVSLSISGDNSICTGSKTYQINFLPANATVLWATSNGYANVTPIGNGSSATVTATTGATGNVNVTATLVSPAGCVISNTASHTIAVGGPYAGFNIVVHPAWPTNCWEVWTFNYFQAQLAFGSGYTSYEWGHTFQGVDYIGPETWDTYTFLPQDVGTYEIFVRPKNSCGVGPKSTRIVEVGWSGPCGGGFKVQVSPNPAKGILYVTIAGDDQKTAKQQPAVTQLTLREVISARIIKQWTVSGNQRQLALNLSGIKKGNYMLTVQQGTNKQSKQIIVE